jgi:general stress protein YciG
MKRFTNFVCPQAMPVLQNAVGMSLSAENWDRDIMKEIGRKGCEHFAEIIIECGRSLDQARLSKAMWQALEKDPGLDQAEFMENWCNLHKICAY